MPSCLTVVKVLMPSRLVVVKGIVPSCLAVVKLTVIVVMLEHLQHILFGLTDVKNTVLSQVTFDAP